MTTAPHRILLVPDARPRAELAAAPKVRRYRLARLRLEERTLEDRSALFAHLRRSYD